MSYLIFHFLCIIFVFIGTRKEYINGLKEESFGDSVGLTLTGFAIAPFLACIIIKDYVSIILFLACIIIKDYVLIILKYAQYLQLPFEEKHKIKLKESGNNLE